ncbi:threonine dehydratase [Actinokineospora baliensis]|uniref:serine/threonine dehydratase n=1 Tax=Actinokineospora baliensis TaxID=547056 RepID=UPI00195E9B0B|nr:serine/threonine dehydratase [Actinokineospora baliensis]MBM7772730.1 threonine dehydratase [Actinokineospora baliensis]
MDHTDVAAAAARIAPHIRRTPHLRTEVNGQPVVLKLEHLQRTGSFKFRGALNALIGGPQPTHVVTASGGNHGVAVATAAQVLGLPATVYVPERAPESKTRRIEAAGAKLVRHGATYAEASAAALTEAAESGARYVPAYDDPLVIAGQGTCAAEVVADVPEVDAFVVAVGGGGLAAGTVLGSRGRSVALVEPVDCQAMHDALKAGTPVDAVVNSVAASALGASRVGALPFDVVRHGEVRSILVSDQELLAARDLLWEEFRIAVEPAAAVPLAGLLSGQVDGKLPCLVICGANSDWVPA